MPAPASSKAGERRSPSSSRYSSSWRPLVGRWGQARLRLYRPLFRSAAAVLARAGQAARRHPPAARRPRRGNHLLHRPAAPTWGTGYDLDAESWSPGIVTFAMAIRSAIESREPVLDLLRGQYPYKYSLGAKDVPLHTLTLRPAA